MSRPKVLYVSSAIGLGHFSKDLAIVNELRALRPSIEVVWLAGHPASDMLADAGETVLPEAESWRGATVIAERTLHNGQLNIVHYIYRSFPAWAHNMRIFARAVEDHGIDAAAGDEAWEVYIPLDARLLRPKIPFVFVTDFVGVDPVTRNPIEHLASYPLNALWSTDRSLRRTPHSVIFIGELEDIAEKRFGLTMKTRREYAREYYDIVGHVVRFRPEDFADRAAWRRKLGYDDRPLVICSVGGTTVGRELLHLCGQAYLSLRERLPDVHMVLVCGPRLPVDSVGAPEGVDVRAYVPRLYEHHACCDVAVSQCGASSTTELAALRTPFIYFPVEGHYEQELVAARLARWGAGVRMTLSQTTPETLADAIFAEYGRVPTYPPIPIDGARKAALHIGKMLEVRAA